MKNTEKTEKYFVTIIHDSPKLEPVFWCHTLTEARAEKKKWKQKYPEDAKDVILAKVIQ